MNYGRYQIIKEVGRGSMGVVFQCLDPHIDRLVAVKVLRTDRVENDTFVKRFLKEAKVIGRLAHPNIVAIYDVGEEQGSVYIAMEFLEGMPLSDVVRGKLPTTREVVALGVQLADALDYAHQKGVVHRDVKPSNIVVQDDGRIKLTDFGIAHVDDSTATLQTQAGEVMGTPAYMSPEQVLSQPVDGRSDIFSLGIILYELSTGRRPFGGESKSLVTVFNEIVESTPVKPVAGALVVPGELSRLIMKALEKDPTQRFQTGREFAEALRCCLPAAVSSPVSAVSSPTTLGPSSSAGHFSAATAASPALAAASPPGVASSGRGIESGSGPAQSADKAASSARHYVLAVGAVAVIASLAGGTYFFGSRPRPLVPPGAVAKLAPGAGAPSGPTTQGSGYPPVPRSNAAPSLSASPAHTAPIRVNTAPRIEIRVQKESRKAPPVAGVAPPERKHINPVQHPPKEPVQPKPAPAARPEALPAAAPPVAPVDAPRERSAEDQAPAARPVQRFAFLKVSSTPPGARVFINGSPRGTTPMIVRLDLGQYQVRLSRQGYHEVEKQVTLEKMKEYPMSETLQLE
jgi:eukaryotic-like serine/threonine-protein kinase